MNSAARDADLRRRLLQRQNQIANEQKTPETPASPRPTASKQSNPVELQRKKRKFQKLRFFLYQLDSELEKTLTRKICLLGAVKQKKNSNI